MWALDRCFDASKSLMVHVEDLNWASQSNPSTLALSCINCYRVDILKVQIRTLAWGGLMPTISWGRTQMLAQEGLNCRQQRHVLATAAKSVAWEGQPWPFLASFGQKGASRMPVLGIARQGCSSTSRMLPALPSSVASCLS